MTLVFETHEQCEHLCSTMGGSAPRQHQVQFKDLRGGVAIWGIGALPDRVYRLKVGRVNIVSIDLGGNELLLRTVRPGEIFGEVCFLRPSH